MQSIALPNPSFETLTDGRPDGWRTQTWSGAADFRVSGIAHSGTRSAEVASEAGADAAWTIMVPVQPYATYRISAWIRTENVRKVEGDDPGARLNLHARPEHTAAITGTRDWSRVEMTVETGGDDALQINCILGWFGRARGRAWFDDLTVTRVGGRDLQPTATVRNRSAGDPISPYIYSQFLEHMGRCIYGGIWAEMLDDRKFFHPVGSRESPWKPVGGARVTMEAQDAFVNDRSPAVRATVAQSGIAQKGLTLQKGRRVTGRIWLRGTVPVEVRLDGRTIAQMKPTAAWTKFALKAVPDTDRTDAALEIVATTRGTFQVGAVSLMPGDNIQGFRADTLGQLKQLAAPLYRWPGGNFVSGYDWRDGLGDPDRRPTRKNPAWQGIESNDVGLHEFMALCKLIDTEPLVVVNTGFGDAHSAAEEVEYVNGAPTTPNGEWRARNGRREPWKVRWWGVGNEMWGQWQLGYMPLNQYVLKHNLVETAMKRVDPTIRTVASGDLGGNWSETMLRRCGEHMDLISEHFYCQEKPGVMGHIRAVPEAIRAKAQAHRRFRETIPGLKDKKIKIAMDEWNYWYGPHVFGELGTRYYWKDGLGIAAGLHEFFRCTDIIEMANYAQTVNVIGAIKTTATDAWLETTGLVLSLYRRQFGALPLQIGGTTDPLDVSAALTPDRKILTLAVINPTGATLPLDLRLESLPLTGAGYLYRIAHPDPQAYNDAKARPVAVRGGVVRGFAAGKIGVPALSVNLWRLPLKGPVK